MSKRKGVSVGMLKVLFKLLLVFLGLTVVLVLPLRWFNPVTTSFILQDAAIESPWVYRQWSDLENISPYLRIAVIASEDQRFPDHYGIDFIELKKALSVQGGPKRGASTVTQQLVKNLYLWSGQGYVRKSIEAYLAIALELFLPKQRILEIYLNVIEYGQGVYGVRHASSEFFNKTPEKLSRIDASLLAAILPSPKKYSAVKPSPYIYNRALEIRFSMGNLGGVSYLKRLD